MNYRKIIFLMVLVILGIFVIRKKVDSNSVKESRFKESKSSGVFLAQDKKGVPVILEWERATVKDKEYMQNLQEITPVACRAYTDVEVGFLKKFPQVVETEKYYEKFRPLFKSGIDKVNWKLVDKKMYAQIEQLHKMDCSGFSAEDIYYFVKVKDEKTKKLLGFTMFLIKPEYPKNTVKDMSFGVEPASQGRGLGKLLISSILKIMPSTECIFIFTRVTNDRAIGAYKAWGFVESKNPIQDPNFIFKKEHWMSLEYNVKDSDTLQKTAKALQ